MEVFPSIDDSICKLENFIGRKILNHRCRLSTFGVFDLPTLAFEVLQREIFTSLPFGSNQLRSTTLLTHLFVENLAAAARLYRIDFVIRIKQDRSAVLLREREISLVLFYLGQISCDFIVEQQYAH